jgi:hypothetical protein
MSATNSGSSIKEGPPKYMMNTVNADLKLGNKATVNKTKQLVSDAERKFKEDHTFNHRLMTLVYLQARNSQKKRGGRN